VSGAIIGGLGKEDFMIPRTTVFYRAVLALASLSWSWTSPALAQAPQASPVAEDKAAAPARKAGEPGTKPDNKAERAAPKEEEKPTNAAAGQAKSDNKGGDNTVGAVDRKDDDPKLKDRLRRRKSQQEMARAKIAAALRGQPMTEAMQQELRRHARRLARLERIKALAIEAKDSAVIDRVTKLIDKENARHDKFTARVEDKDDKSKDKGQDDRGKDDKGKDDKGKDDKAGAK
jgi:hypothetical protein